LHHNDELLGWATRPLLDLDERSPGVIRRVLVSAPLVRQAIFLTLAHLDPGGKNKSPDLLPVANLLRRSWAKEIVAEHFGNVPNGLLTTLERVGPHPLRSARSYEWLWATFAASDPTKANALRALPMVTDRSIQVLDALDGVLVHPEVLKRVHPGRGMGGEPGDPFHPSRVLYGH
jgi:hypothetical protein